MYPDVFVAESETGKIMCVAMQVHHLDNPGPVYERMMDILCDITHLGLIHCDYNEFNVMLGTDGKLTVIDFPQMVSTSHPNAAELFNRDVGCVMSFFQNKLNYWVDDEDRPSFSALLREACPDGAVDLELRASGFNNSDAKAIEETLEAGAAGSDHSSRESSAWSHCSSSDSECEESPALVAERAAFANAACADRVQESEDIDEQQRHLQRSRGDSNSSSELSGDEGRTTSCGRASEEAHNDIAPSAANALSSEMSALVCSSFTSARLCS
jgi:RIO kinase 2